MTTEQEQTQPSLWNGVRKETTLGRFVHPDFRDQKWFYTSLEEPALTEALEKLASPKVLGRQHDTSAVSIQPCPDPAQASQDRYLVQDIDTPSGVWRLRAVMDGHAGEETADYVTAALLGLFKSKLIDLLSNKPTPDVEDVSEFIKDIIVAMDDTIARELMEILPPIEELETISDEAIKEIINDTDRGGHNNSKVLRCMRGTTILTALVDPKGSNLWVASLGDCQAVLGTKEPDGEWSTSLLSSNHNGTEEAEAERIRVEHPGEPECMLANRVIGAIAVTRALGDHEFKLPKIYTDKVFLNCVPTFRTGQAVSKFMHRNLTPPYLSNIPDVRHVSLDSSGRDAYLVLCSDGLLDLYDTDDERDTPGAYDLAAQGKKWIDKINSSEGGANKALHILRGGLGGDDTEEVSKKVTLEKQDKWMDDTTVLVVKI